MMKVATNVDLRPQCPNIYDQGNLGSCVANGTAFGIEFDQTKFNLAHEFTPSRLFIYYNTRVIENSVYEDAGANISDSLYSVAKSGACPETLWPYIISQFTVRPSTEAYTSGAKHLVKLYARVLLTLAQMKQCLIDGFPFIFGIDLYSSFWDVDSDGMVPVPENREILLGGHCMACVGFNDATQTFTVRNSWGNDWGDHGYCYIPYSYLTNPSHVFDLWTIRTIADTEVSNKIVQRVTYGKSSRVVDVTTIFNQYLATRGTVPVENRLFTDPCRGIFKELRITFTNATTLIYPEHAIVTASQINNTGNIIRATNIRSARYGKRTRWATVTTILRNRFSQGYYQIRAGNALFGDPYYGVVKELQITLINNVTKTYTEGRLVTVNEIAITV